MSITVTVRPVGAMYQVTVWRDRVEKLAEKWIDQHLVNGWEGAVTFVLDALTKDPRMRIKL